MAGHGIAVEAALGVPVSALRKIAATVGPDHDGALALWETGIHEARLLAALIAEPARTTPALADAWIGEIRSWDLCDQACNSLFRRTPFAHDLIPRYERAKEEFARRTTFVMIAVLAVHDRQAQDAVFTGYFDAIEEAAADPRRFVNKGVSWALRQTGKRSPALHGAARALAARLADADDAAKRRVGRETLRDLARNGPRPARRR